MKNLLNSPPESRALIESEFCQLAVSMLQLFSADRFGTLQQILNELGAQSQPNP